MLAAVRALGGEPAMAVRAAAAVELTHNFTLLHDDVMDRDTTRRHRPTAWTVFGEADAILAGDAMQALAQRLLAEDPHPAAPAAAARLASCVVELCAGQHADCALERRGPDEVTLDECLAMAEAKTGALLGCACALGALYAGAGRAEVDALDGFGREAGLAFQLIDDVIGIWGDPGRTGKPAGADLAARKKSLPVVAALASGAPAAAELAELYLRQPRDGDPDRMARAVEAAGGRDWALLHAADRMSRAINQLMRRGAGPGGGGRPAGPRGVRDTAYALKAYAGTAARAGNVPRKERTERDPRGTRALCDERASRAPHCADIRTGCGARPCAGARSLRLQPVARDTQLSVAGRAWPMCTRGLRGGPWE